MATAGRDIATATGDLLFSRAFAELAANGRPEEVRVLSDASSALAEGELLQRADAFDTRVALERYLRRCELKTASLFEAACRLGALEAPGGAGDSEALGAFGRRVGLAFQLLDDVLDVSGPASRTGKTRGADLLDGTVTLPLILARERDPELAEVDLRGVATPERAAERVRSHRGDGRPGRGTAARAGGRGRGEGRAAGARRAPAGGARAGGRRGGGPICIAPRSIQLRGLRPTVFVRARN